MHPISRIINRIPKTLRSTSFPLSKINPEIFEGLQRGISLFDDGKKLVSMEDIAFLTKHLETVDVFRGCSVGCTHCLKNAVCSPKNARSILFEDLIRFTEGFKRLNERLGFNVLEGNKYINIVDDSNPTDFPIRGLNRQHSVAEATELIFKNLRIPILFVTSGWNKKSKFAQQSAEELAKQFTQNPQSLKSFEVSINPFSLIMENSRQALKSGNSEKANLCRDLYTSRIANAITTFFDLFKGKKPKGELIYRHANKFEGNELVGEEETRKLYFEIYEKIKGIIGERIEEAPLLNPEIVTKFDKSHLIRPTGRARKYFPFSYNMQLQSELLTECEKWNSMTEKEQREFLKNCSLKCVDINGRVYSTFPAIAHCENMPVEITVPTDIKLNYINKQKTAPVFSDIELK